MSKRVKAVLAEANSVNKKNKNEKDILLLADTLKAANDYIKQPADNAKNLAKHIALVDSPRPENKKMNLEHPDSLWKRRLAGALLVLAGATVISACVAAAIISHGATVPISLLGVKVGLSVIKTG